MAGKHRKRPESYARIPEQRAPRAVRVVDARTRLEHVVAGDVLEPYRLSYLAKCGTEILAASLVEPGRGRCSECVSWASNCTQSWPLCTCWRRVSCSGRVFLARE